MSVFAVILVRIFSHSVSVRIQSEFGKMRTRITPNTDTFHTVRYFHIYIERSWECNLKIYFTNLRVILLESKDINLWKKFSTDLLVIITDNYFSSKRTFIFAFEWGIFVLLIKRNWFKHSIAFYIIYVVLILILVVHLSIVNNRNTLFYKNKLFKNNKA